MPEVTNKMHLSRTILQARITSKDFGSDPQEKRPSMKVNELEALTCPQLPVINMDEDGSEEGDHGATRLEDSSKIPLPAGKPKSRRPRPGITPLMRRLSHALGASPNVDTNLGRKTSSVSACPGGSSSQESSLGSTSACSSITNNGTSMQKTAEDLRAQFQENTFAALPTLVEESSRKKSVKSSGDLLDVVSSTRTLSNVNSITSDSGIDVIAELAEEKCLHVINVPNNDASKMYIVSDSDELIEDVEKVPENTNAVIILCRSPCPILALTLAEKMSSVELPRPPIIVMLLREMNGSFPKMDAVEVDTNRFLQAGVDDVVLQPKESEIPVTISMRIACVKRQHQALLSKAPDGTSSSEKTSMCLWDHVHLIFKDFPRLDKRFIKDPQVGSYIGRTRCITKLLGKGGYSRVFLARNVETQEQEALKVMNKKDINSIAAVKSLWNETWILRSLDHPNVVRFQGWAHSQDHLWILMEYGGPNHLGALLQEHGGKLNLDDTEWYFNQIKSAVAYCHDANVAHRDLKVENVVYQDRAVKLVDFGFATSTSTRSREICGTMPFMAPEILRGEYCPAKADMWSLGLMLMELLCGANSFAQIFKWESPLAPSLLKDDTVSRYLENPDALISYMEGAAGLAFPDGLVQTLKGLIVFDPERRWTAQTAVKTNFSVQRCNARASSGRRLRPVTVPWTSTGSIKA